jgi:hypothetical protein
VQYTRYRRWTRVAVVGEVVEEVEDGSVGVESAHAELNMSSTSDHTEDNTRTVKVSVDGTTSRPTEEESPLRKRLRRALAKPSGV